MNLIQMKDRRKFGLHFIIKCFEMQLCWTELAKVFVFNCNKIYDEKQKFLNSMP